MSELSITLTFDRKINDADMIDQVQHFVQKVRSALRIMLLLFLKNTTHIPRGNRVFRKDTTRFQKNAPEKVAAVEPVSPVVGEASPTTQRHVGICPLGLM